MVQSGEAHPNTEKGCCLESPAPYHFALGMLGKVSRQLCLGKCTMSVFPYMGQKSCMITTSSLLALQLVAYCTVGGKS